MKTKKDWADALREQCFPEEVSPSEESWEGITGRMHRRAVRRKTFAAAMAILVPVGGVLLFGPCQTVRDTVAELEQPATEQATDLLAWQDSEAEEPILLEETFKPTQIPAASNSPKASEYATAESVSSRPVATSVNDAPTVAEPVVPDPVATKPATSNPVISEPVVSDSFQGFPEIPDLQTTRRKRLSVNIHASGAAGRMESDRIAAYPTETGMPSKSSESDFYNIVSTIEQVPIHYQHDIPLSAGLALCWELSPRISLESGLTYSYLHSYEGLFGDQRLHFAGIPLKVNVRLFSAGPLEVSAGGYGMAEKCLSATQGRVSVKEPDIQLSSGVFLDAGYRLGSFALLYLQPSLSYYFTKTRLLTYRTENPLGFSLQAGLRFDL